MSFNILPDKSDRPALINEGSPDETVNLWINDQEVTIKKNTNILEAARSIGIEIPSLCYLRGVNEAGTCRVCLVEINYNGRRSLQASCVYPVSEGLKVYTNSPRARQARKRVVELLLSDHDRDCTNCARNLNCGLQSLADEMGIRKLRVTGKTRKYQVLNKNPFIVRNYNKCVKCRRCEAVCRDIQGINVYSAKNRGFDTVIAPAFMKDLGEVDCISCGQCLMACPTGSLTEREYTDEVWRAVEDKDKFVIVQAAPAIQVSIGDDFGISPGTAVTGKLAAALRRIGFDLVFSTEFTADLTIVEEAHEFLERLDGQGKLPLISSCSPGWVKFCEHFYPEFLDHLSTCKSPMEMFGALTKTYLAEKMNIDPKKIVVVAIMPCTAKKFEAARKELVTKGNRDVDYVLTTRELARMIRSAGIRFEELPDEEFDMPLGISSGAGTLFAATGGVTESAVRTALALTGGQENTVIDFREIRGMQGIKEAKVNIKGREIRIAVVHGTRNAKRLLERIKSGEHFDFIEIMACPGGCVGGGGQPIGKPNKKESLAAVNDKNKRTQALYRIDAGKKFRRAHENPVVNKIYSDFLGHPLSAKAKEILHTKYAPRGRAINKMLH